MPEALIVGASRGIGAATATRLSGAGWSVTDLSRTTAGVDVTDRQAYAQTLRDVSPIPDLLIYCAGAVNPRPFLDTDDEDWDYHTEVNLTAAARTLRWWAKRRIKWHYGHPASAILVASTAALRPPPGWSAYASAKAGLVNLGLTTAVELAPLNLRVYVVAPGRCATHLRATLAPDEDPASIMQPNEVAETLEKLANDTNGVLAGQVIEVARRG